MKNRRGRPSQRIRRKNMGYKKLIVVFMAIFIVVYLLSKIVPTMYTYSRYFFQSVRGYYLGTKNFYFNSDKLSLTALPSHFEAANWSGIDPYDINIKMNSKKNQDVKAEMDINYNIEITYSVFRSDGTEYPNPMDLVEIDLDKPNVTETVYNGNKKKYTSNSTIFTVANNEDLFKFSIIKKPGVYLADGDYIVAEVKTNSTSPYLKSLAGDFKISIGNLGMSYRIEDSEYDPYFKLILTNTLDYYLADDTFSYTDSGGETRNITPRKRDKHI